MAVKTRLIKPTPTTVIITLRVYSLILNTSKKESIIEYKKHLILSFNLYFKLGRVLLSKIDVKLDIIGLGFLHLLFILKKYF